MLRRKQRTDARAPGPGPHPITVHVVDDQQDLPIDDELWADLVQKVLAAEGVDGPGEANVLFVGTDAMADLNRLHMGADGPTDVLSFPLDGGDDLDDAEERLVGDIVICPAIAAANAAGHAGSYPDEIAVLLVHGTLHLLGHDHAQLGERERMWRRERELIAAIYGPLTGNPWTS